MLRPNLRLQRGEIGWNIRNDQLKDLFGAVQTFERMKAQIANLDPFREVVSDQLLGCQRHQNLTSVGQRSHSGAAIDR